jgi:hypothetical protein
MKDEPSAYGGSEEERTAACTMKPSSASQFPVPLRPTSSVNVLASCTEGSSSESVGMKPQFACERVEYGGWLSVELTCSDVNAVEMQAGFVGGGL